MFSVRTKKRLALLVFSFFSFSANSVYAQLADGTFSGSGSGDFICSGGSGGPISGNFSASITVSGDGTTGTIDISSANFNYSGTGPIIGPPPQIQATGTIDISGTNSIDGSYPNSPFDVNITALSDGSIEITGGGSNATGGTPCDIATIGGSLAYGLLSPATLSPTGLSPTGDGDDDDVVTEETPSNTVTDGVLLTTQTNTINNNITTRTGDVLRNRAGGFRANTNAGSFNANNLAQLQQSGLSQGGQLLLGLLGSEGLSDVDGTFGLNAGEDGLPFGLWASYSYTDFENDFTATEFDGSQHTGFVGADIFLAERLVLGIAVGYEFADIDTDFNGGEQDSDGYSVVPYLGLLLNETWSVDFSVGFSEIENDQFRIDPATGAVVSSDTDTNRWFAAFNVNGLTHYKNWTFGFRTGVLRAFSRQNAFTESDGTFNTSTRDDLGEFSVGGDISYLFDNKFEPFVQASYQTDFELTEVVTATAPQPDNDRNDILFGLGLRYFHNNISGNFEWRTRLDREDFDENSLTLTIRADF